MIVKNIALLGHKDHGKSTLIGQLLIQTGAATKVRIKEAETYSKRLGRAFEPAFILDSFAEERLNEMTYDTTRAEIKHKDLAFALIDVPGHEELIKNMISGASYGEAAVLLVSAKPDEGIRDQTKRHLFIARMLGINRLIVAVNKMDTIGYSSDRFNAIAKSLNEFILSIGFEARNVAYIPISAYAGENLTKKSMMMKWYKGKPLIDLLYDNSRQPTAEGGNELRIVVQGTLPNGMVAGKIVSGSVKLGEKVVVLPEGIPATIGSIVVRGAKARVGTAGENVALSLEGALPGEMRGTLISATADIPKVTDRIRLKVFVTGAFGKSMRVKFNGVDIPCKTIRVLRTIDTTTGEIVASTKPKLLEAVEADVTLARKVPVESYGVTRELGRFVLYNGDRFVGIGISE